MKILATLAAIALTSCGVPLTLSVSDTDDDGNTVSAGYSSKGGIVVDYSTK